MYAKITDVSFLDKPINLLMKINLQEVDHYYQNLLGITSSV